MVPWRLLVVDDSAEVAFIVRHIGRKVGWEVASCPNAEQARVQVQQSRPDLLLLDVHLPRESGYEFCRWLRTLPGLALFSHWQHPQEMDAAGRTAGADFVLSKELLARPEECRQRLEAIRAGCAGREVPL
jgi:DNA-binding response OmpR family regulator